MTQLIEGSTSIVSLASRPHALVIMISEVARPSSSPSTNPSIWRNGGYGVYSCGSCAIQGQEEARYDAESPNGGYDKESQATDKIRLVAPQKRGQAENEDKH